MSILVGIRHSTTYKYDRRITLGPQAVRLRPAPHCRTPIVSYSLKLRPAEHFLNWVQDPFSNYIARLVFPEKTTEFAVDVDLVADLTAYNPFDFFVESYAETYPCEYPEALYKQLAPFLELRGNGVDFGSYLAGIDRGETPIIDFLVMLNQRLCGSVRRHGRGERRGVCKRLSVGGDDDVTGLETGLCGRSASIH